VDEIEQAILRLRESDGRLEQRIEQARAERTQQFLDVTGKITYNNGRLDSKKSAMDTLDGRLSRLEAHHLVNDVQLFSPKTASI
jgi:hypothetical protein